MSWLEKIQTDLIIRTGDGKEYRPQWLNASKTVDYNVAEFEFPQVSGTLVSRGTPKGRRYPMQIFFQGDDHLDVSSAFEVSANDPRPWTLTHPFYGRITVQPASLEFDNTKYNVSEIRGTLIETITEDYPQASVVPQDKILADVEAANAALAVSATNAIEENGISAATVNDMEAFLDSTQSQTEKIIAQSDNVQGYYNALNKARASLTTIGSEPLDAIEQAQAAISAAAAFTVAVQDRLNVYAGMLADAQEVVGSALNLSDKVMFQANGGAILTAMCYASATPLRVGRNPSTGKEIRYAQADYNSRTDVLSAIELLLDSYNSYLATLDSVQSEVAGSPTSFIPDATPLQQLSSLVNYTLSNLFNIALNARQERSIVLEYDSNWIILAHRFYGLTADDSTIEQLILQNNAGLSEMLQVQRNRKIVYYV